MDPAGLVSAHLEAMARRMGDAAAVVGPSGPAVSFAELHQRSEDVARGLVAAGVGPGTRVAVMVPPSPAFFEVVFGLFRAGAVLVGVDPGLGLRRAGRCIAHAAPAAFIGTPKAHWARRFGRWGRGSIRTCVKVGRGGGLSLEKLRRTGASSSHTLPIVRAEDPAAVLFTSGATGAPKGACYTHGMLEAQVRALQGALSIQPGEVDVCTFPLFALYAPAMGMTAVIPEMDFLRPAAVDAEGLVGRIRSAGATNLFGSPALLDAVARWGGPRGVKLPTLKRVLCAGAPVRARIMRAMSGMLEAGAQVHSGYGATEALPVAVIGSGEVLEETEALTAQGRGICVGRAVAGVEVAILPVRDEPIPAWSDDLPRPPGEVGEITVRGEVVTRSYHEDAQATALAKVAGADGAVWHRMGDLGCLDEQGRLWVWGRKSQRVRGAQGDLYTLPCEGVFDVHPEVHRTALVGVERNGAQVPALCVELERPAGAAERERVRQELLSLATAHDHTRPIRHVLFHPRFPVDTRHNAKIGREKLAAWAAGRLP